MFFKRKSVEYWVEHEQELRKDLRLNLWISLALIPIYVVLWHYQMVLLFVVASITGFVFFELIVDFLSLQEVKVRLRRINDS
jgi:hypothetical protein